MAKEIKDLREELCDYKYEFDLLQRIPCTNEENKQYQRILKETGTLPDGVYAYVYDTDETSTTQFYRIYETDLSDAEIQEYLTYKKLSLIKTIKNCAMFFTILTIISMIAYFILFINAFNL